MPCHAQEQWGGGCSDEYWEAEAEAEAGAEAYPYSYCVQCGADGDPKVVTRWWNTDVMVGIVREGPYIELVFCYGELPDAIRSRGTCILDGREGRLCGACMDTLCSLTRSPVAPEVLRAVGIGADVLPAPVLELVLLYACPELSLHPPAAPPPKRA